MLLQESEVETLLGVLAGRQHACSNMEKYEIQYKVRKFINPSEAQTLQVPMQQNRRETRIKTEARTSRVLETGKRAELAPARPLKGLKEVLWGWGWMRRVRGHAHCWN